MGIPRRTLCQARNTTHSRNMEALTTHHGSHRYSLTLLTNNFATGYWTMDMDVGFSCANFQYAFNQIPHKKVGGRQFLQLDAALSPL